MANEEHLTQLKRGLKLGMRAWDEWRKDNPDIRPDLRKLRLVRAFLRGANLCDADLHGAYLPKANLLDAKLCRQTSPRRTSRTRTPRGEPHRGGSRGAYLASANLTGTNFTRADLRGAVLARTLSVQTNFKGANSTGVRFTEFLHGVWNSQEHSKQIFSLCLPMSHRSPWTIWKWRSSSTC